MNQQSTKHILAIFVIGKEEKKTEIGKLCEQLLRQIRSKEKMKKVDVAFFINESMELTEILKHMLAQSNSTYYTFFNENYEIDRDYIDNILKILEGKTLSQKQLDDNNIFRRPGLLN